jgi:hypothetical protein
VRVYDRIGADERVALRDYGGDERTMGNFRLRLVPILSCAHLHMVHIWYLAAQADTDRDGFISMGW